MGPRTPNQNTNVKISLCWKEEMSFYTGLFVGFVMPVFPIFCFSFNYPQTTLIIGHALLLPYGALDAHVYALFVTLWVSLELFNIVYIKCNLLRVLFNPKLNFANFFISDYTSLAFVHSWDAKMKQPWLIVPLSLFYSLTI